MLQLISAGQRKREKSISLLQAHIQHECDTISVKSARTLVEHTHTYIFISFIIFEGQYILPTSPQPCVMFVTSAKQPWNLITCWDLQTFIFLFNFFFYQQLGDKKKAYNELDGDFIFFRAAFVIKFIVFIVQPNNSGLVYTWVASGNFRQVNRFCKSRRHFLISPERSSQLANYTVFSTTYWSNPPEVTWSVWKQKIVFHCNGMLKDRRQCFHHCLKR